MDRPLTVGVLGGMGPAATLDFFAKLLDKEKEHAGTEQERLRILIDCNPAVPDRNRAVAGEGPSPGPVIAAMARGLEQAGADFLVMPCNTAHAFLEEFRPAVTVPLLSIVEETVEDCLMRLGSLGGGTVGLLATTGTVDSGIYEEAFAARGVPLLLPSPADQRLFMDLLYEMKEGDVGLRVGRRMLDIAVRLLEAGAGLVVAGCTEVPLVLNEAQLGAQLISSTDVLVEATVAVARGRRPLPPS